LWQIRPDGGEPEPVTTGAGEDDEPAVSPDGTRLMFTNTRNTWELRIQDRPGVERRLLEKRSEILFPLFSPDGRHVVFFGRAGYAVAIFTIGTDGSDLRQLTAGRELNHQPRWSHDGTHVVFYQIKPELSVRRVPALGGASTSIFNWNWETENALQYDRSGQSVVYTRLTGRGTAATRPARSVIREMPTGQERELPEPRKDYCRFSPDGRWIAGSERDGSVVVCPTDGRECRKLATADRFSPSAWSGDGSRVYFLRASKRSRGLHELWSIDVDGKAERPEGSLGPFRSFDIFFDVSVEGRIVSAPIQHGRRELWRAAIK
jgi:Tol biopolymer transport system component